MFVLQLVGGVEEVEAVARVGVEGGGGEAAVAVVEAMGVEAEEVDAFGLLHADQNIKNHPPPRLMGVLGRLLRKAPSLSSGRSTWKEQVRSSSMRIIAPLLLNSPQ